MSNTAAPMTAFLAPPAVRPGHMAASAASAATSMGGRSVTLAPSSSMLTMMLMTVKSKSVPGL